MRSAFVTAVFAFIAGAGTVFVMLNGHNLETLLTRKASQGISNVPTMSPAAADAHRENAFSAIRTIEDLLALPGDFARAEALYALAGRADSIKLHDLIFQADGILDVAERRGALTILFSRLTEMDPASALAMSRSPPFASEPRFETAVWQSWARLDLEAALGQAVMEDAARRHNAAKALFAAYGYWGNDTTDYISRTLGMQPGTATLALYMYQVADRDPAAAVAYVNTLQDPGKQHEAATLLGSYLGQYDFQRATRVASLFEATYLRDAYESAVASAAAQSDPIATLDELLANPALSGRLAQVQSAMQALAERDIDQALAYLERVSNPEHREQLANSVALQFARSDPDRALAWAKENDRSEHASILSQVLSTIARENPELAVDEAQKLSSSMQKQHAFNMIAMLAVRHDPQQAVALLEHVDQPADRNMIAETIARSWMLSDPDAALEWMLKSDAADQGNLFAHAAQLMARADPDNAMRWLSRVDEKHRPTWRIAIASNLATQRSFADAQSFIAQFENSDDYPQALAAAVAGIARSDIEAALQMAARVPAGRARDSLYTQLISHQAQSDPQAAAEQLASVSDVAQRAMVTSHIATTWQQNDPARAQQWVDNLPRGAERNQAIMYLASNWDEMTPSRRQLLDSIDDDTARSRAFLSHIYHIANSDWRRAEGMLDELDLTSDQRQQAEDTLQMIRDNNVHVYIR